MRLVLHSTRSNSRHAPTSSLQDTKWRIAKEAVAATKLKTKNIQADWELSEEFYVSLSWEVTLRSPTFWWEESHFLQQGAIIFLQHTHSINYIKSAIDQDENWTSFSLGRFAKIIISSQKVAVLLPKHASTICDDNDFYSILLNGAGQNYWNDNASATLLGKYLGEVIHDLFYLVGLFILPVLEKANFLVASTLQTLFFQANIL